MNAIQKNMLLLLDVFADHKPPKAFGGSYTAKAVFVMTLLGNNPYLGTKETEELCADLASRFDARTQEIKPPPEQGQSERMQMLLNSQHEHDNEEVEECLMLIRETMEDILSSDDLKISQSVRALYKSKLEN